MIGTSQKEDLEKSMICTLGLGLFPQIFGSTLQTFFDPIVDHLRNNFIENKKLYSLDLKEGSEMFSIAISNKQSNLKPQNLGLHQNKKRKNNIFNNQPNETKSLVPENKKKMKNPFKDDDDSVDFRVLKKGKSEQGIQINDQCHNLPKEIDFQMTRSVKENKHPTKDSILSIDSYSIAGAISILDDTHKKFENILFF